MKKTALLSLLFAPLFSNAQLEAPKLSPTCEFEQVVGLTEIEISYSRPSKRGREVFGNVVPLDKMWRTGANKNAMIETSEAIVFGSDTLASGTYSIFTKPSAKTWTVYFYKTTDNWGTPDEWLEENVVLEVSANVMKAAEVVETFTISIDAISLSGATLSFAWDKTKVAVPFKVLTDDQMTASITKVMDGPSANDYYRAADYYFSEKKDLNKALAWMDKALEKRDDKPFWMYRKKSLIQAELGDKKGAIATAKISLEAAQKAGNDDYVKMNEESIKEWSK